MKRETYYLGAYWGARVESPERISQSISSTMQQFVRCHKLLPPWHERADSIEEAAELVVEPVPETIAPLLTALEPSDPTSLGYSFSLWNGRL